jgi:uncharacterized membrane protein YphA (DoxX/SURF4 family)
MQKFSNWLDRFGGYSTLILRVALGIVFLYFGYTAIFTPNMWVRMVPAWTAFLGEAVTLVRIHGIFELLAGIFLILGIQTRWVALLLFVDLLHILTLLSFGPVWMRDLGLAGSMLSLVVRREN